MSCTFQPKLAQMLRIGSPIAIFYVHLRVIQL